MNAQSQTVTTQLPQNSSVWYELRSEREKICQAMLHDTRPFASDKPLRREKQDRYLQARLRLLDEALDRLMSGTYGDCVVCGRWIEDTKLHLDPAFRFCVSCERAKG
jgi:RNA polymerase-binding transcription factor DksA